MTTGSVPRRLYLMQVATQWMPIADHLTLLSVGCSFVQTSDGRNILIDTGLPANFTPPPELPPMEEGANVIQQLASLGLRPDDVDTVISTHLDIDHVGFHDAFPTAGHIVHRSQYELAREGQPRFAAGRLHWDHPALNYRLLDDDIELVPGLKLITTSAHTPGHLSVLVHLPTTGPVLLAGDAVPLQRHFTPDRAPWPFDDNTHHLRASTQKLLDLADRENVSLVVFHHDGQQWQSLKKAPEWYE
jgi:N-acyl homoserine lactone hydrolase